jgi:hypothetical protein
MSAVVVSPLIPRNLIDHQLLEHASVVQTLVELFSLEPLAHARVSVSGLTRLASLDIPRKATPERLPDALPTPMAVLTGCLDRYGARVGRHPAGA